MEAMEEQFWFLAIAGGALLLGAVLVYGIMKQRRLSPAERAQQNRKVRSLYGKDTAAATPPVDDGSDQPRARTGPIVLAVLFVVVGCILGYFVIRQPTAPSPSVEGKETNDAQPAAPADKNALPGQS